MRILGIKTKIFLEGESLFDFVLNHISSLDDGDIVVVTSKIVALSEGRTADISQKESVILRESKKVIRTPWAFLTLTDDGWNINAGVDESNAKNKIILLPRNPFLVAERLLQKLRKHFSVKKIGVIVTDTKSLPLRVGTVGRAIGYAGFSPVKSYIGKKDLFGRKSRVTQSNHVDALATAAVLIMGEGDEGTPIAIINNAPVKFVSRKLTSKEKVLFISPSRDIFAQIYKSSSHQSGKNPNK